MLHEYWPEVAEIDKCISIEAEKLPDHVIMAVHEPMLLQIEKYGTEKKEIYSVNAEKKLLEQIKSIEYTVPIIGEAGSGKSHLIRLIDIRLRNESETKDWIVRRIPKGASLRDVLTILLSGLEGEIFDAARKQVENVGQQLSTNEVARHLNLFLQNRLKELHQKPFKYEGMKPTDKEAKRYKGIKQHAAENALPALLADENFNGPLLEKGGFIYKLAQRLTSGASDDEIIDNDYELKVEDLDFSVVGDLGAKAKEYIRLKKLNTDINARQSAVDVFNAVISDACSRVFHHFFNLHGGNFSELFREIRKHLNGQTVVILVEDFSLISAIEEEMVEVLTEGKVDGYCTLHSAIAVTPGNSSYANHRNSLWFRAEFEWTVVNNIATDKSLYDRIENFCGKYLNATRFGSDKLKQMMHEGSLYKKGVPVFKSDNSDVVERVASFGSSPSGHPLFPYNKSSIKAFVNKHCKNTKTEKLFFNPRAILQSILIPQLTLFRSQYSKGMFPPAGLDEFAVSSGIAENLNLNRNIIQRSYTLAAIWGYGANNSSELAGLLPADVAREFSLDEFADLLDDTESTDIKAPPELAVIQGEVEPTVKPTVKPIVSTINPVTKIVNNVDSWFEKKDIPQTEANILRQTLNRSIEESKVNVSKWHNVKSSAFPSLRNANGVVSIDITYNKNATPAATFLSFGSPTEFTKDSLKYRTFLIAVLCFDHFNQSWDYPEGYKHYLTYQNFVSDWVPNAILQITNKLKETLKEKLTQHYALVTGLYPSLVNKSSLEKLAYLCQSKEQLDSDFNYTGIELWDETRQKVIKKWDQHQKEWLNLTSINHHAIEGDLVLKSIRGMQVSVNPYAKDINEVQKDLSAKYSSFKILDGTDTKELFEATLNKLKDTIEKMSANNQYIGLEGNLTSRQVNNRITKVLEENYWHSVKSAMVMFEPFEVNNVINALNKFVKEDADKVDEILVVWNAVNISNFQRLRNINIQSGGVARENAKKDLSRLFTDINTQINKLLVTESMDA